MRCSTRKHRDSDDIIMLEGPKLIREALASGLSPEAIYFSRKRLLLEMMPQAMSMQEKVERLSSYKTFVTPYKKLNNWSSVVKGQGVLGQ